MRSGEPSRARPAPARPGGSTLATATLWRMVLWIGPVVIVATTIAYLYMVGAVREAALRTLETYVTERGQREQILFTLAHDNHALLKRALEERIRAYGDADPRERFDALFVRQPDGLIRNRPEGFDGKTMVGVCIGRNVVVDADVRRRVLASHDVVGQYGPALRAAFQDTYVTLPDNILLLYWPEQPTWCQNVPPDFDFTLQEYFWVSDWPHDPSRTSVWTGLFYDSVAKAWMTSIETPLDIDGRHVATIGHDVLLDELMDRTLEDHLPGGYNLIVRRDGRLIASAARMEDIQDHGGAFDVAAHGDEHLRTTVALAMQRAPGQVIVEDTRHAEYVGVVELDGPDWYLMTVLPASVVRGPAFATARLALLLGVLSLAAVLAVLWAILRRRVQRPLLGLIDAVDGLASGTPSVPLDVTRPDELGRLGRAFQAMAAEVGAREAALRRSQRLLQDIIDTSTAVVFVKDLDGRYLLVNRRFCQLLDRTPDQVIGQSDDVLFPPECVSELRANDRLAVERGCAIEVEEHVPHDGVVHSYIAIKCPLEDGSGRIFATCGISTDITERKRAEQERAQLYREAEEANRVKDEFLATLSHELRTPLNAIVGWAQALREDDLDRETAAVALASIERNARIQTQLVADLLDVSRIVSGKMHVALRRVAVSPIVEAAVDTLLPTAEAKGVDLRATLDDGLGPVAGDPDRLQQVVWNLVSNAIKFTPKGGRVDVRSYRAGADAVIEVCDTGVGIRPSFLPHLFQRFTQADGSDAREHGGLGLGLAIVRHLVELHGGKVEGWSAGEGCGAWFRVRLPMLPASLADAPAHVEARAVPSA